MKEGATPQAHSGSGEPPKKQPVEPKAERIRLVVVDLDGTLLDASKVVRPRIKAMVHNMRKAGVRFTIATGRFYRSAVKYARELALDTPIITSSGAQITEASGLLRVDLKLPLYLARRVVREAEKTEGVLYAFFDDEALVNRPSTFTPRYSGSLGVPIRLERKLKARLSQRPIMLVLRFPDVTRAREVRRAMREWLGDAVRVGSSMPYFVDFLHPRASKANALAALCGYLGIDSREVLAIGDGENDLEMLEYAGIGALVSNAPSDLKCVADYVSDGESADGVIEIIERFVFGRSETGRISQIRVEEAQ